MIKKKILILLEGIKYLYWPVQYVLFSFLPLTLWFLQNFSEFLHFAFISCFFFVFLSLDLAEERYQNFFIEF